MLAESVGPTVSFASVDECDSWFPYGSISSIVIVSVPSASVLRSTVSGVVPSAPIAVVAVSVPVPSVIVQIAVKPAGPISVSCAAGVVVRLTVAGALTNGFVITTAGPSDGAAAATAGAADAGAAVAGRAVILGAGPHRVLPPGGGPPP